MSAIMLTVVIAFAIGFGLIGYQTGRSDKAVKGTWLPYFVVVLLVLLAVDVWSGFALAVTPVVSPWLVGFFSARLLKRFGIIGS